MEMIKGITIIYLKKVEAGRDGFNRPLYSFVEEAVENVLVSPVSSDDFLSTNNLNGKKAIYTLAIPKGDTHDWEDCVVEFFGRRWKSIGIPLEGIEENIPMSWNKKVTVEWYG